jgi:CRP-like cAMP-binding protein
MQVTGLFRNEIDTKTFQAGETIFEQGDPAEFMYGVVEGEVEIKLGNHVLSTLGPDEVFGEMALVDQTPRSATAVAQTDCKLAIIDHRRFLFLVQETPTFALQVMSTLADRLRRMNALSS